MFIILLSRSRILGLPIPSSSLGPPFLQLTLLLAPPLSMAWYKPPRYPLLPRWRCFYGIKAISKKGRYIYLNKVNRFLLVKTSLFYVNDSEVIRYLGGEVESYL